MKAALLEASPSTTLRIVDDITPVALGPNDVLVRIDAAAVCGSDLHAMSGDLWVPKPIVMGHEAAGEVVQLGADVATLTPGDRVVVGVSFPCGKCDVCVVRRSPHLCEQLFFNTATAPHFTRPVGDVYAMGASGSFSEQVVVRRECLVRIDDDVPAELAALLACGVTTGAGAVWNTCGIREGSTVAVLGLGAVGLAAVEAARIAGARSIWGVDPIQDRQQYALARGAAEVHAPRQLEGRQGDFDYVVDTVATSKSADLAWSLTGRGGTYCVVGMGGLQDRFALDLQSFYSSGKKIVSSYHGGGSFSELVDKIIGLWRAGTFDLGAYVTARGSLEDVNKFISDATRGLGVRSVVFP